MKLRPATATLLRARPVVERSARVPRRLTRAIDYFLVRPALLKRIDEFAVIGIGTGVLQLVLLYGMIALGFSRLLAAIVALHLSVMVNFLFNRFVTWRDRFLGLTQEENLLMLLPLFFVFEACSVSVWVKMGGMYLGLQRGHLALLPVWLALEAGGVVINFLTADRFTFAKTIQFAKWLRSRRPAKAVSSVSG